MAVSVEIVVQGASEATWQEVWRALAKEIGSLCQRWNWEIEIDELGYCLALFADQVEGEATIEAVDQGNNAAELAAL